MSRDLIAEVADEVGNRWHADGRVPMASNIEHHIAAVLRERFEVVPCVRLCNGISPMWVNRPPSNEYEQERLVCDILVPRSPSPVPSVEDAARAFVDWWDNDRAGYAPLNALRAALKEAKR